MARSKNLQVIQIKTDNRREALTGKIAKTQWTPKQKAKDL
jgi:hypothetical protein